MVQKKTKYPSVLCLACEKGQRRMASLVRAERKTTVIQIITFYACGEQKRFSEHTTHGALRWMGYNGRKPHWVPLLSAKLKNGSFFIILIVSTILRLMPCEQKNSVHICMCICLNHIIHSSPIKYFYLVI